MDKEVRDQLKKIKDAPAKIAAAAAGRLRTQIAHEFAEGVAPDGQRWKPLGQAALRRHAPPAFAGSRMGADATVTVVGTKVVMTVPHPAEFHQGTRPMLPSGDELPESYEAALSAAADDVLSSLEDWR